MLMKETRSAIIEMHPAGCAIVRVTGRVTQTLDDARENVGVALSLCGGTRAKPLLVDITRCPPLNSEVRHYYVGGALADNFTALGLLVEPSPMGRMMGNVFFRMIEAANTEGKCAAIPTQVFEDEESAVAWLASGRR